MKKKKINTGLILFVSVAVALSYYLFFRGDYSIFKWFEYKSKYEKTQSETDKLNAETEEQKKHNELLKNRDSFEMEKKARENGMIKDGETIYKYEIEKEN
ncbi:MAG: septum formation initiator family protein [Candidatus Delongbacteria bacterium]|nr:septum formation initiator family protein [Candidatus Delongbacteria bacterium]MCG2760247.1 septum formation initiator family protein [Candidatus Delongbacteria bacterium]